MATPAPSVWEIESRAVSLEEPNRTLQSAEVVYATPGKVAPNDVAAVPVAQLATSTAVALGTVALITVEAELAAELDAAVPAAMAQAIANSSDACLGSMSIWFDVDRKRTLRSSVQVL